MESTILKTTVDEPSRPSATSQAAVSSAPPAGRRPTIIRQQVRPKHDWLTAVPVTEPGKMIRKPNQTLRLTRAGEYEIHLSGQVIDVCTERELQQFYDVKAENSLAVSGEVRRLIEDRLGVGSTADEISLLGAIERVAKLQIGTIEIVLSPGQWEEIHARAAKNGRAVDAELQQVVRRIEDELFHGGVGRGVGGRV